jgi:ankyrin repeat protein
LPLGNLTIQHLRTLLQHFGTGVMADRDDSGKLPIHIACEANAPVKVLALLVEMDPATLQIADNTGSLPLHLLCCSLTTPTEYASVRYLVEQGGVGTLAARNPKGALPLHNLVASNNPILATVHFFIKSFSGAVTEQTNEGLYPFMVAACETSSASLSVIYDLVRANPSLVLPR